jgi:hypothetical protein
MQYFYIKYLTGNTIAREFKLKDMEALFIAGSDDTPHIHFDKKNGIFEISGRSLPEDSLEFFLPIIDWVRCYSENPNPQTNFIFKLDYFNTASSKFFQDILSILESVDGVTIHWYTYEGDEDVEMSGEEYAELVEIPFIFKSYT